MIETLDQDNLIVLRKMLARSLSTLSAVLRLGEGIDRRKRSVELHEESLQLHKEIVLADPMLVRESHKLDSSFAAHSAALSTPTRRVVANTAGVGHAMSPFVTVRPPETPDLNNSALSIQSPPGGGNQTGVELADAGTSPDAKWMAFKQKRMNQRHGKLRQRLAAVRKRKAGGCIAAVRAAQKSVGSSILGENDEMAAAFIHFHMIHYAEKMQIDAKGSTSKTIEAPSRAKSKELFDEAMKLEVPFFQWSVWIRSQLTRKMLQASKR